MKRMAGFTLLEVLAALVLLALLMVGVYAGVRTATRSARIGSAQIERLDQVRSAQQLLRHELAQILAQPIAHTEQGEQLLFYGTEHEMRYVAPLPGYLGKFGPQLQRLRLTDDSHGGLQLEMSLAVLPPDGQPPQALGEPQVLVDHVESGSFSYRGTTPDGSMSAWLPTWPDGRWLPRLVRVTLTVQGHADWPQLTVPLRVEPTIGNDKNPLPAARLPGGGAP